MTSPSRIRPLRALAIVLASGILAAPAIGHGAEDGGLAVAPMTALDVAETTAAILTGIAEGQAAQLAGTGRFVAHGELLRVVDGGPDRDCRSTECLARAAAALGSAHLLTGEVGRIGESHVVTVQLTRTADAVTVSAASRQCEGCDEGALPALLDDAMVEALGALDREEVHTSDDGRTVHLSLRRRASSAHFLDRHRVVAGQALAIDTLQLSSLTRAGEPFGCLEPGEEVHFVTTLQAVNTGETPTVLDGELLVEIVDDATGDPSISTKVLVQREIGVDDGSGERFDEDGSWIPPANVWKESVELRQPGAEAAPLRVRVSWNGELLEELVTGPAARVTRVDDLYLEGEGERVAELSWGEPMAVHLVLTKLEITAAAEVTLQVRRKLRYWFDTDDSHAFHAIATSADGAYHLVLPWVPPLSQQSGTESVTFEVWVNGCLQHRSPVYR